jgi:hypothetical protein
MKTGNNLSYLPITGLVWPSSIAVLIPVHVASFVISLAKNNSQPVPPSSVTTLVDHIPGYMADRGAIRMFCLPDKSGDGMRVFYV